MIMFISTSPLEKRMLMIIVDVLYVIIHNNLLPSKGINIVHINSNKYISYI